MFRLAGEISDGAIAAWCPIPYLLEVALPELARGARAAGRPRPPLVANVPVVVHRDRARVRAAAREALGMYLIAPAYAEMFAAAASRSRTTASSRRPDRRAVPSGSPDQIAERLIAKRDAGVDEVMVTCPAEIREGDRGGLQLLGAVCASCDDRAPSP
jgi:alkanesulfonate monooxygenase SsuD/methylene tetrahydromethanopterin reductase-like flavin-dependent oxidoreductase (luciferase family)